MLYKLKLKLKQYISDVLQNVTNTKGDYPVNVDSKLQNKLNNLF